MTYFRFVCFKNFFFLAQSFADVSDMLPHVQAGYVFSGLFLCIYTSSCT